MSCWPETPCSTTWSSSNAGAGALADNAGHEFQDYIPAHTTYVADSASAGAGTIAYNSSSDDIVWDGVVPSLGVVNISFQVTVDPYTPDNTIITNQGTHNFDSGGTNTNDASQLTDDPTVSGSADPTNIVITVLEVTSNKTVTDLNGGVLRERGDPAVRHRPARRGDLRPAR